MPMGPGRAGGDVHYLSVCSECNISRIAFADVSGHGQAVAVFGVKFRELMQKHLHFLEQLALMRDLNQAVRESLGEGHYATMVAFRSEKLRDRMVLTNAGIRPPFSIVSRARSGVGLRSKVSANESTPAGCRLVCSPTSPTKSSPRRTIRRVDRAIQRRSLRSQQSGRQ